MLQSARLPFSINFIRSWARNRLATRSFVPGPAHSGLSSHYLIRKMATAVVMAPAGGFDPNDVKYKCCCNSCHVKTGCIVIGILEAISCVSFLGYGGSTGNIIYSLIWTVVTVIILVLFFLGLYRQRSGFLIPHMVYQVVSLVVFAIFIVIIIVVMVTGATVVGLQMNKEDSGISKEGGSVVIAVMVAYVVILVLGFALNIWFFTIVLACYRFFKAVEQQQSGQQMAYVAGPQPTAPPGAYPQPYNANQPPPYSSAYPEKTY